MAKLQIIGAPQSTFVWSTRLAATEKGIEFESIPERPHTPEVLAINPFGKIPAMRHGDVELSESRAIIAYIDAVFDGPRLTPKAPAEAGRVEQWTSRIITEMCPVMLGRYIIQYLFPMGPGGAPDRATIDAAVPLVEKQFAMLGGALAKSQFLAGPALTIADLYIHPLLSYLRDLPESAIMLSKSPAIMAYHERLSARPSFQAVKPPTVSEEDRARAVAILTGQASAVEPMRASA